MVMPQGLLHIAQFERMTMQDFILKQSDIKHKGLVFDLKVDRIQYNESGNLAVREVAVHGGGAVVVPVTAEGKIVFVKQFRYPLQNTVLELPAGKLDINEDPMVCARRELAEETGYRSDNITKLGKICTTPGFCTEILHIYMAKDLVPGNHNREEGEIGMQIYEYSLSQIDELVREGILMDGKTLSGILLYKTIAANQ